MFQNGLANGFSLSRFLNRNILIYTCRSDMAQQQFSEIEEYLRLLKERREQARRNIFCGVCGKQHPKAVMKDKPTHAARWCGSCRVYHPANEGDVWLESKFLGTKYHIYARIDNVVVDITEWGESSMSHRTSLLLSPPRLSYTRSLSHTCALCRLLFHRLC